MKQIFCKCAIPNVVKVLRNPKRYLTPEKVKAKEDTLRVMQLRIDFILNYPIYVIKSGYFDIIDFTRKIEYNIIKYQS